MKKEATFPGVKVNEAEYAEVWEVLEILDIPYAQLARTAIRKEIAELKRLRPELAEQIKAARAEKAAK